MDDILRTLSGAAAEDLQQRIDIIRHKLKFIETKPYVACIEKLDPLTIAGDWLPEGIAIAGGYSLFAQPEQNSIKVDRAQLILYRPDIIVIALRGQRIGEALKEIETLLQLPGFTGLKAVKDNRLYIADGCRFYDSGPAVVEAIEMLAEIINPKQFVFGYEGDGWMQFLV